MDHHYRYKGARGRNDFIDEVTSLQYSATYHDQTPEPSTVASRDCTDDIQEILRSFCGPERESYSLAEIRRQLQTSNPHELVHTLFAFEKQAKLDIESLAILASNALPIILGTPQAVLDWHVRGHAVDAPDILPALADLDSVHEPVIYRITLVKEDGTGPDRADINRLIDALKEYNGPYAEQIRCFALGLMLNKDDHIPFCFVGYTSQPGKRRSDHLSRNNNSNRLMGIIERILNNDPASTGNWHRTFHVLFRIFERCQAMLGEIIFTRLAQCTVNMGGFTFEPPGRSIASVHDLSRETWLERAQSASCDASILWQQFGEYKNGHSWEKCRDRSSSPARVRKRQRRLPRLPSI